MPRQIVHERFGGTREGGIAPSSRVPAVLFFTDPVRGHRHGYYDGIDADGLFEYVGEGLHGDQKFTRGNKAIRDHQQNGKSLEGFLARGTTVTYLGEFALVDWYQRDAHETGDEHTIRQVIVFRLHATHPFPIDLPQTPVTPRRQPVVELVAVEERHTERGFMTPQREPVAFERAESALVGSYRDHLVSQGHEVSRLCVVPPGEGSPLYSDLWDATDADLIEAKGSVTRDNLRQAVGQLLDYGRFANARTRTILTPARPRPDLLDYVRRVGIDVVYPDDAACWIRLSAES